MFYRMMNLCVKADPVALLSIEIREGNNSYGLETFADAMNPDEYHFMIKPKDPVLLKDVSKAIARAHPEFKQEIKTQENSENNNETVEYLYITMPEVNDDRYKVLVDGVDLLYKEFKARIELTYDGYVAKIGTKLLGAPEEEIDEAKEALKEINDNVVEMADKFKDQKLKEIEMAHDIYLSKQNSEAKKKEKEEKSNNRNAGMSMRMFGQDDDDE